MSMRIKTAVVAASVAAFLGNATSANAAITWYRSYSGSFSQTTWASHLQGAGQTDNSIRGYAISKTTTALHVRLNINRVHPLAKSSTGWYRYQEGTAVFYAGSHHGYFQMWRSGTTQSATFRCDSSITNLGAAENLNTTYNYIDIVVPFTALGRCGMTHGHTYGLSVSSDMDVDAPNGQFGTMSSYNWAGGQNINFAY